MYNFDEETKIAAKLGLDSLRNKNISAQILLFTKFYQVLGAGANVQSDLKGGNTIEVYSSFHSKPNNFIIGGKFTYNTKT